MKFSEKARRMNHNKKESRYWQQRRIKDIQIDLSFCKSTVAATCKFNQAIETSNEDKNTDTSQSPKRWSPRNRGIFQRDHCRAVVEADMKNRGLESEPSQRDELDNQSADDYVLTELDSTGVTAGLHGRASHLTKEACNIDQDVDLCDPAHAHNCVLLCMKCACKSA